MPALGSGHRALLRRRQEAQMLDELEHLPASITEDSYGEDVLSWPAPGDGTTYPCGFDPTGGREERQFLSGGQSASVQTVTVESTVRLSAAFEGSFGAHDRVRITKRFEEDLLNPPAFEVIGVPELGPSGLMLKLRSIMT